MIKFLFIFLVVLSNITFFCQDIQAQSIEPSRDNGEFSLFETRISVSVRTAVRRLTGIRGFLFGHYSVFDDEDVMKRLRRTLEEKLAESPIGAGSILILPLVRESLVTKLSEIKPSNTTDFFGKVTTHFEGRFLADYLINVNVLLPKDITQVDGFKYLGQVTPILGIGYFENGSNEWYEHWNNWHELGRLDHLTSNEISFVAFEPREEQDSSELFVSLDDVAKQTQYELGRIMAQTLPPRQEWRENLLKGENQLRIYLAFKSNIGEVFAKSFIETAGTLEEKKRLLKGLGLMGIGRFFRPSYYRRQTCSKHVSN